ncbi:MAG: GerW family sporulation protein [Acutalibacteraceae bacterium]|nr:GerW family sporulation protein [Acutalibacteraceae bacterium]
MSDMAIKGIMDSTMDKIKTMVDADTIIGNPISLPHDITLIPVSKVSFGFASGGSDLPTKKDKDLFGGGAGAGVSITPTAFICVSGTDVKLMHISKNPDSTDKIVSLIPEMFDKIVDLFKKDENQKSE